MVGGGPEEVGMRSHRMASEEILGMFLRSILRMAPEYYTTIQLTYYTTLLLYFFTSKLPYYQTTNILLLRLRRLGGGP